MKKNLQAALSQSSANRTRRTILGAVGASIAGASMGLPFVTFGQTA